MVHQLVDDDIVDKHRVVGGAWSRCFERIE